MKKQTNTTKMAYKFVQFAIIAFLLSFTVKSFSQSTITLKMCHDSAEINFPLVNQKEKIEKINRLKQQNLKSNYYPSLNLTAKATYQSEVVEMYVNVPAINFPEVPKEQYSANIEINQLIYDGGNINAAKKVSQKSSLVDIQKVEVDIFKIKEQINQLYFNCLLLQENVGILNLTHETIIEQKKTITSSVNQGVVLPSELDNLDAELLRLEQQIIEIKSAKKQTLHALGILSCIELKNNTE